MNDFTEIFKSKSNYELLTIIQSKSEYKPIAIQTAREILESRELSPEQIDDAKNEISEILRVKKTENQRKRDSEKKLKLAFFSFIDPINPLKSGITGDERIIRSITLLFGFLFFYKLYDDFWEIQFLLRSQNIARWDGSEIFFYFAPILLLPTAVVLFHQRKVSGWNFFAILSALVTMFAIHNFISSIRSPEFYNFPFSSIFPAPETSIYAIILYGGILWQLCRESIRKEFSVNKNRMYYTVGSVAILTIIFFSGILLR